VFETYWRKVYSFAIKEISRRKYRTVGNILGFIFAVSSLVAIVSFSQAYSLAAVSVLRGTGTHFMAFIPESFSCGCEGLGVEVGPSVEGVYTRTFNESIIADVSNIAGVRDAAPYFLFRYNKLTIGGMDIGKLATYTTVCASRDIVKGQDISSGDKNDVLLEESFADTMGLDVNQTIDAFDRTFRIVGIVNTGIKPAKANMYASIDVVQEISRLYTLLYGGCYSLTGPKDMNVILVEVSDARLVEDVEQAVIGVLNNVGSASISGYNCYIPAARAISISDQTAWSISLIISLFVILFALKSQLSSVVERTKEIGVLKAVGWTDSNVMNQIVAESLIQGIVGGTIGGLLGCAIAFLVPFIGLIPKENLVLVISPPVVAAGLAISVAGGVLAGIFPAWRAARLRPSEALRRF
jgi:putative ABC transport system permease protein